MLDCQKRDDKYVGIKSVRLEHLDKIRKQFNVHFLDVNKRHVLEQAIASFNLQTENEDRVSLTRRIH